jgi:4-amino-4-deoxy-L-arabinose transferase-like glycosyltransferase
MPADPVGPRPSQTGNDPRRSWPDRPTAADVGWLLALIVVFLAIRLPAVWMSPASQDEEWYSVPGLTVAREGVPRVPYARADAEDSVYVGSDRLLFAMPPGLFYAEAIWFRLLPVRHGTARLASLTAAVGAIVMVWLIGRDLMQDRRAAGWSAGIYAFSRLVLFPATVVRPDMLCGFWGLTAVWCLVRSRSSPSWRWVVFAGIALGMGGLAHPFAIVFALQCAAMTLMAQQRMAVRGLRTGLLAATALATFGLWLPLIVQEPQLFRQQFLNNILLPAGPGLFERLVTPWPYITGHLPLVIERGGVWPLAAATLASLYGLRRDRITGGHRGLWLAGMAWSAVYLLLTMQGHHPLEGYWCYPMAFLALNSGRVIADFIGAGGGGVISLRALFATAVIAALLLPGSGLRATVAAVRHWGDADYDSARFVERLLADIPPNARLIVGTEYALDVYGHRPDIVLGIRNPLYFDATKLPYDYVILGRMGLRERLDEAFGGELWKEYGRKENEFACYAVVLKSGSKSRKVTDQVP